MKIGTMNPCVDYQCNFGGVCELGWTLKLLITI